MRVVATTHHQEDLLRKITTAVTENVNNAAAVHGVKVQTDVAQKVSFILLTGKPLYEPVARYSVVMIWVS